MNVVTSITKHGCKIALSLMILISGGLTYQGCANYEVCYDHPKYGRVCVTINGKKFIREDLTDAQRREIEADQLKNTPGTSPTK